MKKILITILTFISFQLVHADLIVQKLILKCTDKLTVDGAIVTPDYSVDIAQKTGVTALNGTLAQRTAMAHQVIREGETPTPPAPSITEDPSDLDAAANELWDAIQSLPSVTAVPGLVTHVGIKYDTGWITINIKDGTVNWPKVTNMDDKTKAFLDAVVTAFTERQ